MFAALCIIFILGLVLWFTYRIGFNAGWDSFKDYLEGQ